ncbi:MAG TPA: LCP family protein [Candidatus Moranbacteria bacterium]|nr:LCP family protein [Candidatus Moranbacteria bacterium]
MFDYKKQNAALGKVKTPLTKRKWFWPAAVFLALLVIVAGVFAWRASSLVGNISSDGNIFGSFVRMIPGVEDRLKGEEEGRINVLLLGMRGENVAGGGTLADTIMVASIRPAENKVTLFSVPRDFYVPNPATGGRTKINAVYAYGQENGKNEGMANMKKVVGEIVGSEIHYGVSIDFKGFTDLINALGGVEITLDSPFEEPLQFREAQVCDSYTFTVPAIDPKTKLQMTEKKYHTRNDGSRYLAKEYKLCYNQNNECGGDFKLPAGTQTLAGDKALCYVRSRKTTSDFDRARRQQQVIEGIKNKALAVGTLTDFEKVNGMLESLGNNVKTDMQLWEMKRFYELQQKMQSPQISQFVLENSEKGLLYAPQSTPETGYILSPIGDNYDRIRAKFAELTAPQIQPSPQQ